jgi:hypothetical protein
MDCISQFANAQITQQRMDDNAKLKNFALQICHEFNLRVTDENKKEALSLSLVTDRGLPVGHVSVIKDYRTKEDYYEISMHEIICKEKSSARSDRSSRDSDKISTLIKSIKKNKEVPTIDKLTKNYLQCLFYAISRVGEARRPDISIHQDVALSAIKYALGIDTMGVQLHTAKLQEVYDQYMKEVSELSTAKSNQDRYLKGCTAIGIVGGRWSDDTANYYLVGDVAGDEEKNIKFQGDLTRYSTLADTEHASTAAMIRTYMQGSQHRNQCNIELAVPWGDRYYDEIDIATGYTGNTGLWVLIPKHAE